MKNKLLLKATICSIGFFVAAYTSIALPVVGTIAETLKITNQMLIGLIITLPCLTLILTNLLSGKLSDSMSKKTLIYIGTILFLIGGLGPVLFQDIWIILAFRAILGLGVGFIFPILWSISSDFFEGAECVSMIGIVTAAAGIFSAVITVLAGFLGKISWQAAFGIHAFGLVILLMIIFFLPAKPTIIVQHEAGEKAPIKPIVFLYFLITLIIYICIMVIFNTLSLFIEGEKLGTVATTGLAGGLLTLLSFIGSILFSKLFGFFKKYTVVVCIACLTISFFLLSFASSITIVFIALAFTGFGMGLVTPIMMTKAMTSSPKNVSFAMSIVLVGILGGQFLSTFFIKLIGLVSGNTSMRFTFLVTGAVLVIATLVAVVTALRTKNDDQSTAMHH